MPKPNHSAAPLRQAIVQLQKFADALEQSSAAEIDSTAWQDALRAFLALDADWAADQSFEAVLRAALHVVNGSGAGLALYDPAQKQLIIRAAVGMGADNVVGCPVPLEDSISGLAFATGEIQASRPLYHGLEQNTGFAFRSVLVAPLMHAGEAIGTITAVNKIGADGFTSDDIAAFQHFSELAARLVNRKQRELSLIAALTGGRPELPLPPALAISSVTGAAEDFAQLQALARLQREAPHARRLLDALIASLRV